MKKIIINDKVYKLSGYHPTALRVILYSEIGNDKVGLDEVEKIFNNSGWSKGVILLDKEELEETMKKINDINDMKFIFGNEEEVLINYDEYDYLGNVVCNFVKGWALKPFDLEILINALIMHRDITKNNEEVLQNHNLFWR